VIKRLITVVIVFVLVAGGAFAAGAPEAVPEDEDLRIALLVKSLGNAFFEAARDGAMEAAEELGDVEIIYQGPDEPTAEGQIEIIDSLIAQGVHAIAISSNDPDALVPATQRAQAAGIEVVTFDSDIHPDGRSVFLAPSDDELIGRSQVQAMAEMIDYQGQIAILSASATATNQNIWIEYMQQELEEPEYSDMELVDIVYGDDLSDQSYREAMGLFSSYPDLAGIISPTTVGVAATARAIEDEGLVGQVQLTGLGLPSEMSQYVQDGVSQQVALWNPIELGYGITYIAYHLVRGNAEAAPGAVIPLGELGEVELDEELVTFVGEPFVFDASNIADFEDIY